MRDWQDQYLRNVREVAEIRELFSIEKPDFGAWYVHQQETENRLSTLKAENNALLSGYLFPLLDSLPEADTEEIAALETFADHLMDWKVNLDSGVYVAVHDALLSLNRLRRDRDGIIRELYKLGMGLYYLHRAITGVECRESDSMHFHNEMVFTEAASYFRYFGAIENNETRAYVIRAMANVSICSNSAKRRINASMKTIRTVTDPEYRAAAPDLPWDTYLSRAHMQLSSCRSRLSEDDITRAETAAVMDSCYEVFKPQKNSASPGVRWLWPYYDMEYTCGYVGAEETAERLAKLIRETPMERYDTDGLYGNVQLPIFSGRLLRDHEQLRSDPEQRMLLDRSYRKMMQTLMTIPREMCDDYLRYVLIAVVSDFYEIEGSVSYREVTTRLMQRFAGRLYLNSLKAGDLMRCFCGHILQQDPEYFSRMSVPDAPAGSEERRDALLNFAAEAGLYHDFGLFKMGMERITQTRSLFENEDAMYRLHTVSGYGDLHRRKSTAQFADTARGHHSAYAGGGTDLSGYVRMESPYRRMTDLMAIVSDLLEQSRDGVRQWAGNLRNREKNLFSPRAAAFLTDESLLERMETILNTNDRERCRLAFDCYYSDAGSCETPAMNY